MRKNEKIEEVIFVTAESYIDHSYTIAEELQKHIRFPVFMQAREQTDEIDRWCKKLGAEFVLRKRFRNPFSFFHELKFILRLRKMNADITWFDGLTFYQVLLAKLFIKEFLVTVHDVEKHPGSAQHHASTSLKMTFWFLKKNICVVSKSQAEIFKARFGFDAKLFRLPIINYFTEAGKERLSVRDTSPGNKTVKFFFFGSVEPYKGIEYLLDAVDILNSKGLNFSLGIYGRLKYNIGDLKNKISSLKNTVLVDEFIDYRAISNIYAQNDVIILPYRQVTQCGPLLIGYNENVPSICSNQKGFYEYIDEGKSALVFNNTAGDLAEKMELLIKSPGKISEMKNYIQGEIHNKFSMPALAKEYIENFNR